APLPRQRVPSPGLWSGARESRRGLLWTLNACGLSTVVNPRAPGPGRGVTNGFRIGFAGATRETGSGGGAARVVVGGAVPGSGGGGGGIPAGGGAGLRGGGGGGHLGQGGCDGAGRAAGGLCGRGGGGGSPGGA